MAERKTAVNSALVVFVILSIVSGGFMFAMMLEQDEMTKKLEQLGKTIDAVATERDGITSEVEEATTQLETTGTNIETKKAEFDEWERRDNERFGSFKDARGRVAPAWEEVENTRRSKDREIEAQIRSIEDVKTSFKEQKKGLVSELTDARRTLEAKKKSVKNFEESGVVELAQLKSRLKELQLKIARIKRRREQALVVEADGSIVKVGSEDTSYVAIDIGRVHGVRVGMKFSVFHERLSGARVVKGSIQVTDVRPHSSDCVIMPQVDELPTCPQCGWVARKLDMRNCVYCFLGDNDDEVQPLDKPGVVLTADTDKLNPIVAGDFVSNPYFSPGEVKTFVFGGETIFRSKREIRLFVEENGGKVEEKLTIDTDYLIAGTGDEANRLLKRARDIGVKVMKEDELYEFFGEHR